MAAFDAATPAPGQIKRGPWRSITHYSARTPLRIKLIAALVALVIAAMAGISIAGVLVFRDYLRSNTDQQVTKLLYSLEDQLKQEGVRPGAPSVIIIGPYVEAFVPAGEQLGTTLPFGAPQGSSLPDVPNTSSWLKANAGKLVTVQATSGGDSWRVIAQQQTVPTVGGNQVTGTAISAEDLGDINTTLSRLTSIDLIVGAIVVLALAVVGVAVVRASLQPLSDIEQTAGEIAAGDLTRRVTERDPRTEVGSLGRSLNAMLAQIESAFRSQAASEANARWSESRMRQFAADASHELRTPLTAIKGYAEYYRQRGGSAAAGSGELDRQELDRIMRRVEDEATRMGGLVEDLLLLARVDQQRPMEHRPVDVLALAADAVQDARMIAPDRDIKLDVGRGAAFLVLGDEARLRQVIGNLMANARTHTPAGTAIEVRVRSGTLGASAPGGPAGAGQAVLLEVSDHGAGMTAEQAQHVFERFYRADAARNRKTGGSGLGLAIVSALVSAHGGTVSLDTAPGQGATFRVALPLAPEALGADEDDEESWGAPSPAVDGPAPGFTGPPPGYSGGQPDVIDHHPRRPFTRSAGGESGPGGGGHG